MAWISTLIARFALPALLSAALACGAPSAARAAEAISEQDAHAIGVRLTCISTRSSRWT